MKNDMGKTTYRKASKTFQKKTTTPHIYSPYLNFYCTFVHR